MIFEMASNLLSSRPIRIRDYRFPGELLSLCITFLIVLSLYGAVAIFYPVYWSTTVKAVLITLAGLAVYIFSVKLQQRAAFGTLVKVSDRQFPELYKLATEASDRLSTNYVPVYVKRASEMNIYTLGFRRPLIVLTSSLVDQMPPDSLQFFIGREIGHVAAGHTWLRALLKPVGSEVPVIGRLLNSVIFGDWINCAEKTADRAGFLACRSLSTSVDTMLKFGVGIRLYDQFDIPAFLNQIEEVGGVPGYLTEIIAEQPYLTQRVKDLVRFACSEHIRQLLPEKPRNTRILSSLPETFLPAGHASQREEDDRAQIETTPDEPVEQEVEVAAAASAFGGDRLPVRSFERDTVFDTAVTDLSAFWPEEDNHFDPNLMLAGATETYQLRRWRTRLGRNRDNDIVLDDERVSRDHVEFVRQGREIKLMNLSRNGVWVNNRRVDQSAMIQDGDELRIGRQKFTFHLTNEE
jgi:FHA domain/Peptidase family M48